MSDFPHQNLLELLPPPLHANYVTASWIVTGSLRREGFHKAAAETFTYTCASVTAQHIPQLQSQGCQCADSCTPACACVDAAWDCVNGRVLLPVRYFCTYWCTWRVHKARVLEKQLCKPGFCADCDGHRQCGVCRDLPLVCNMACANPWLVPTMRRMSRLATLVQPGLCKLVACANPRHVRCRDTSSLL